MTPEDAIRWLAYEAHWMRTHDQCEEFCLWLPAIVHVLDTTPMTEQEASAFRADFRRALQNSHKPTTPNENRTKAVFQPQSSGPDRFRFLVLFGRKTGNGAH